MHALFGVHMKGISFNFLPGYRDYYNKYKDIVLSKTDVVKMKDI